jgi:hypothetical protein
LHSPGSDHAASERTIRPGLSEQQRRDQHGATSAPPLDHVVDRSADARQLLLGGPLGTEVSASHQFEVPRPRAGD